MKKIFTVILCLLLLQSCSLACMNKPAIKERAQALLPDNAQVIKFCVESKNVLEVLAQVDEYYNLTQCISVTEESQRS